MQFFPHGFNHSTARLSSIENEVLDEFIDMMSAMICRFLELTPASQTPQQHQKWMNTLTFANKSLSDLIHTRRFHR